MVLNSNFVQSTESKKVIKAVTLIEFRNCHIALVQPLSAREPRSDATLSYDEVENFQVGTLGEHANCSWVFGSKSMPDKRDFAYTLAEVGQNGSKMLACNTITDTLYAEVVAIEEWHGFSVNLSAGPNES